MAAAAVMDGADNRQLVGDFGLFFHQLAKVDTGKICFNCAKGASVFGRSLGLGVVGLKLGWATGQLDINDAGFLCGSACLGPGLEELRQS